MTDYNIARITEHVKTIEQIVKEGSVIAQNQQDLLNTQISVMLNIHDTLIEIKQQLQLQFQQLVAATNTATPPAASKNSKNGKN
ncbi:hypothetical protein MAM1_0804d11257 [Mucor ambiguus]|uniref:Uncharacterized protein n=1 Tax=Mucor ambiguus TaxID=91626 RepID=A0A0C9MLJ5_9FUNG|nr:hypothetical protein MAM1_0804d11257 [Mucor ambiguus]